MFISLLCILLLHDIYKTLFLTLLGFCCCVGFSLAAESGGYSLVSVWASHCNGVSCCGAQALGYSGFSTCGSWALEHRLSSCGTGA